MKKAFLALLCGGVLLAVGFASARQTAGGDNRLTAAAFENIQLRNLGPGLVTGRVVDAAIDPKDPNTWYVASAFGGLWKTNSRGIQFRQVFPNEDEGSFTLCCVVVDPKDSNVIWVGTGEAGSQRSAHFGDGIYKSTDAGETWKRMGLESSEHLGKIAIDPRNSNSVWVAAQGPLFTEGGGDGDRGLYHTIDGGATWTRPVYVNSTTGFNDVVMDPKNPDLMFASTYQRMRHVGQMIGGGPDGGIWKSTDGGKKWTKLTNGLPPGEVGKIALAVDPKTPAKQPSRIYALIDAKRGAGGGGGRGGGRGAGGAGAGAAGNVGAAGNTAGVANAQGAGAAGAQGAGATGAQGAGAAGGAGAQGAAGGRAGGRGAGGRGGGGRGAAPDAPYVAPPAPTENDGVGFYRSDDAGVTWTRMANYRGGGPAYFCEIFVDPNEPDTIWSEDTTNWFWSRDGGKTWRDVGVEQANSGPTNLQGGPTNVHVDQHVVLFDPTNRNHIIIGNDGGLYETYTADRLYKATPGEPNRAEWRLFGNLPITQYYRVSAGNELPFYTVCGGTQDDFSECGPSRTTHFLGIRSSDWYVIQGGDGFFARHDWADPNIVYGSSQEGGVSRYDRVTGRNTSIRPPQSQGRGGGAGAGGGFGDETQQQPEATGGRGGADRPNWDCPYIVSPHLHTRLYWGTQYLYRSDDRGDNWVRISPDLTRNLDYRTIPIMGKVWPADSIAFHESTTALSTIVAISESPLREGLLYVGTDDGLIQVSEDGGKNWRKQEDFTGVPKWTYVSSVYASPRDADVVFATLNNWQTGDYKAYIVRSDDRGHTWKNVSGDLPAKHDVWAMAQDRVNGNLLFAGTEFGLFFTVDGGSHWTQLKGGMPREQVRDLTIQDRESDVVMATFGRGFWVLDDYSALREVTQQTLSEEARLFPLRHVYEFQPWGQGQAGAAGIGPLAGNYTTPNPPIGAVFTYNVGQPIAADAELVLDIKDNNGREIHRMNLSKDPGLRRVVWNLRADQAPQVGPGAAGGAAGGGGRGGGRGGRGGGAGAAGAGAAGAGAGAAGAGAAGDPARGAGAGAAGGAQGAGANAAGAPFGGAGGGGGRGGGGAMVEPGRYVATLSKLVGTTLTPLGPSQAFQVDPLPERNYMLYR